MTSKRLNACQVAVIGAGPYGLSVAAHLRQAGLSTHVFGDPMSFWRQHMPKGMMLRSPRQATDLSFPDGAFQFDAFALAHDAARSGPLPLEEFVAYGEWFQANAIPDVDRRVVQSIEAGSNGFQVALADGDLFAAKRVVIAAGLINQDYRPPQFRDLPATLVSHTCEHADLAPFSGKRVAVIGRGQSACESAALLAEAGAEVEVVSRGAIHWLGIESKTDTTLYTRLSNAFPAPSAVGPFPLSWLAEFPGLTHRLPTGLRNNFTSRCLKAGASGWLLPRFGAVKCNPGRTISRVRADGNEVVIEHDAGSTRYDHVLLGTGYQIDIARIGILGPKLLDRIDCSAGSPILRAGLESSVPRLHFVGSSAVRSFGPLMRFIAGAPYAARAITAAALAGVASGGSPSLSPGVERLSAR